jgi:hypothetical protein
MNKVHMVNQHKPKLPRHHSGFGPWLIIAVIIAIGAASMIAQSVKADPVSQCSITGVDYDNLMSEERAEFMVMFEHGEEFTEFDME